MQSRRACSGHVGWKRVLLIYYNVAGRNFCPHCGSLLFGTPQVVPDVITIYVGTLDHPGQFQPDHAIFVRDRLPWDGLPDDLDAFDTTRS